MEQYISGSVLTYPVTYRRNDGTLVDPTAPHVVITYPDASTTVTITPTRRDLGQFTWTWTIPEGAPVGTYTYIDYGTIEGVLCQTNVQVFEVVSDGGTVIAGALALVDLADNALTTPARLKMELGLDPDDTTQDDHLRMLINVVSGAIESELNRDLGRATVTELVSGYGRQKLNLRRYPVASVTSAKIDGVAVTDYRILPVELGQLWRRDGWPLSANRYRDLTLDVDPGTADLNVEIAYTGGYVLPAQSTSALPRTLPWVIEGACLRLAVDLHNRGPGLKTEQSAAGFRYEVDPALLEREMKALARFRRWA